MDGTPVGTTQTLEVRVLRQEVGLCQWCLSTPWPVWDSHSTCAAPDGQRITPPNPPSPFWPLLPIWIRPAPALSATLQLSTTFYLKQSNVHTHIILLWFWSHLIYFPLHSYLISFALIWGALQHAVCRIPQSIALPAHIHTHYAGKYIGRLKSNSCIGYIHLLSS